MVFDKLKAPKNWTKYRSEYLEINNKQQKY